LQGSSAEAFDRLSSAIATFDEMENRFGATVT
jgi:hypothetical protein